jgi:hypothetical protein
MSKVEKKKKFISNLSVEMMATKKKTRPNCQKILKKKEFWYLPISELRNKQVFEKDLNKLQREQNTVNNFYYNFIQKKLNRN